MGATTSQWQLDNLADEWPYQQPVWVFTHLESPTPAADVRFVSGEVAPLHRDLVGAARGKHIWVVGGGDLAGQFADAGLLDEIWIQYAPVALGAGAPLLPRTLDLTLLEVARNRDFCCARYAVGRVGESST